MNSNSLVSNLSVTNWSKWGAGGSADQYAFNISLKVYKNGKR